MKESKKIGSQETVLAEVTVYNVETYWKIAVIKVSSYLLYHGASSNARSGEELNREG